MKKFRFLSVLLVLTLFVGLSSCGSDKKDSPGDTVTTLFKHIKDKDYAAAASLYVTKKGEKLSEEEVKKIEGLLAMASQEYNKKGGLDKVTIDEETIDENGESAKVKTTIHFKNGKTDKDTMHLNKIDGEWLIKITN